ncbi:hypothetical protein ISCGN_023075 [Ixodes scapularis]
MGTKAVRVNRRKNIAAVDTQDSATIEKLLRTTVVHNIKVRTHLHIPQRGTQGVVRPRFPSRKNHIQGGLQASAPITETRVFDKGRKLQLRFDGPRPRHVELWGMRLPVLEPRARPTQCGGCGRLGHLRAACTDQLSCTTCKEKHEKGHCPKAQNPICPNCNSPHDTFDRRCSAYQHARATAEIAARNGGDWSAASREASRQEPRASAWSRRPPPTLRGRTNEYDSRSDRRGDAGENYGRGEEIRTRRRPEENCEPTPTSLRLGLPQRPPRQRRTRWDRPSTPAEALPSPPQPRDALIAGVAGATAQSTTPSPQGQTASARPEKRRRGGSSSNNKRGNPPGEEESRRDGGGREESKLLNERPGISRNHQIIAIQEPTGPVHKIHLSGYVLYTSRVGRPGAHPRAALLVKKELPQYRLNHDDLCGELPEYAAASVTIQGRPIVVVSAYVAPRATGSHWNPQEVQEIRRRIPTDSQGIICGDFNAHSEPWGDGRTTQRGAALQAVLDDRDLVNITQGAPTYVGPCSGDSVVDLTLVTRGLRITATPAPDSGGSDHQPIIIGKPGRAPQKKCSVTNWEEYQRRLKAVAASGQPLTTKLIEEALKASTRTISETCFRPNPDFKWTRLGAQRRQAQRKSWRTNSTRHRGVPAPRWRSLTL